MPRWYFFIVLAMGIGLVHAEPKPAGFLWYNLPQPPAIAKVQPKGKRFSELSYQQRDAVLSYYTQEAWHQGMQEMSVEAMRRYFALQKYWVERATDTSRLFEKTLLAHPEYRYDITHPNSQIGLKVRDEQAIAKEEAILKYIASTHGLLYFYRGNHPVDQKQNAIIQHFSAQYGLSLIPVSVDGVMDETLPNSRRDFGQVKALGVQYFPALYLVNPKTGKVQPVAYGLVTQDMLSRQFALVATDFAKGDL